MKLSEKVLKTANNYLNISPLYKLTVGIYYQGKTEYLNLNLNKKDDYNIYSYDIGSISKTFTAHLALKLVDLGLLDLDKPIDNYLDLKNGLYPSLRDLLSHQAGYHHLSPLRITLKPLLLHGYQKKNPYEKITDKDVIKCIKKKKKTYPYSYSDFPYAVVAVIISRALNKPFGLILSDFIQNDLGLLETKLAYEAKRNLPGYIKNKKVNYWEWEENNPYLSGGGIVSNIRDLLKYISLEIEDSRAFIKNAQVKEANTGNIIPCLGWHTYLRSNQLWHVGGVSTFRSSIIINKTKKIGVVVLGNAKGKRSANVHYLAKQIYSEIKRNKISI